MKRIKEKLEALAAAVAFAEAGEFNEAERMLRKEERVDRKKDVKRTTQRPRPRVYKT
ncbi:MAG: hypothetical protein JRI45_04570 [Deltaproteobacteria bacterium]|nr:hypothetical protein [Deltaproteobacteria bacterium]MBW2068275.1 hypothetical protein [Deltaproteobacteria bacterium]